MENLKSGWHKKDLSLVLFEFDRSEIYLNIILPKEHKMMHSEKISGKVVFRSRVTNAIFLQKSAFYNDSGLQNFRKLNGHLTPQAQSCKCNLPGIIRPLKGHF